MPDWALDNKASWSYRLSGGSDLAAANPLAVKAGMGKGDVQVKFARSANATDQPVAMVRTGTGRIDVAAGQRWSCLDYINNGVGATIYTAGMRKDIEGEFTAPRNQLNTMYGASVHNTAGHRGTEAAFADNGGAITIQAGKDVVGAPVAQMVNNWLFRQGRSEVDAAGNTVFEQNGAATLNTAWWTRFDYFNQGIATFAGGDVSVVAGGDVKDLSASVATNAYMPGKSGVGADAKLVEYGGGDLSVRAGGDILGGSFYVQKGTGALNADGSIIAGSRKVASDELRTILAVGDASFDLTAGRDLELETAYNPTLTQQNRHNWALRNVAEQRDECPEPGAKAEPVQQFLDLRRRQRRAPQVAQRQCAAVAQGRSGRADAGGADLDPRMLGTSTHYKRLYTLQPGTFSAVALGGDITADNGFSLAPSPRGQLELLAAENVNLKVGNTSPIVMLDVAPEDMSPYYAPRLLELTNLTGQLSSDARRLTGRATGLSAHTAGGLHSGDTQPVRIVAASGDIVGARNGVHALVLPKKAEILAGRDIRDLGFNIQHLDAADVTKVSAGRDFINSTVIAQSDNAEPGDPRGGRSRPDRFHCRPQFRPGQQLRRGRRRATSTIPHLPTGGAGINIVAGATGADYAGFARKYVAAGDLSADDQSAMVAFVRARRADLPEDIFAPLAWKMFKELSTADQKAFLEARKPAMNKLYFAKLGESAKLAKTEGLALFDDQIATMFPSINPTGGDINLFASQLKTEQGGSIGIFAPGGSVYAGLAHTPSYLNKPASNLGIFTIRGGDILGQVKTDFLVNQGRVFTVGGGDIALASQYGDLNAGKGSRTASSSPAADADDRQERQYDHRYWRLDLGFRYRHAEDQSCAAGRQHHRDRAARHFRRRRCGRAFQRQGHPRRRARPQRPQHLRRRRHQRRARRRHRLGRQHRRAGQQRAQARRRHQGPEQPGGFRRRSFQHAVGGRARLRRRRGGRRPGRPAVRHRWPRAVGFGGAGARRRLRWRRSEKIQRKRCP